MFDSYADKLGTEGMDWLQEILLNAQKMGALIDALLGLSRVTQSEITRELVDLSALVKTSCADLARAEEGRAIELVMPEHLYVDVDLTLARALIENLIANAWKFTRKTHHARIELGVNESEATREFFIRDNGAGFDMAFANKLFAPFQRLHATDEFPGTGIGLATAQRIVRRHGGRIRAEGIVDHGATFYFTLPTGDSGKIHA